MAEENVKPMRPSDRKAAPISRLFWFCVVTTGLAVVLALPRFWNSSDWPSQGLWQFLAVVGWLFWVRRVMARRAARLLWSLRNRLLAAYVFVAVVPIVLIISMVLVTGYLLAGQYAAFLLNEEIRSSIDSNAAVNKTLAAALAEGGRGANPEAGLATGPNGRSEPLTLTTYLYPVVGASPRPGTPPLPAWLHGPFQALVRRPDGYYFAAYSLTPHRGHAVGVLTLQPLNSALLNTWVERLGTVIFHGAAGGQSRAGQNFQLQPGSPVVRPAMAAPKTARALPPAGNAFDRSIYVPATVADVAWESGKPESDFVTVATRLSILNRRLFTSFVIDNKDVSRWPLLLLGAIGIVFGLIELVAMVVGVRLTRSITLAVDDLYLGTQRVNQGDLAHQIPVRHHDQLAALEESFNTMTASLQKLLEEQRETQKLEDDLAIAHEVQAQLFPQRASQVEGMEIYGHCVPARVVSGDYYDFLALGPEQVGIALGDVSGKGISAALLMANIGAAVRAYQHTVPVTAVHSAPTAALAPEAQISPAELMERLNNQLHASTPVEKYATLFYAFYDGRQRTLRYTNAGHLPPAIIGPHGVRHLTRGGTVVGMFPDLDYEEGCVTLLPGDLLVAWSDGISEPENEYGEEFGETRLVELVRSHAAAPLAEIVEVVLHEVNAWHGADQEPPDDMTLVLARVS